MLLLTWQAHFAAHVCFSTCPDSQKCHAGLAVLQNTSDSAAVPRSAAGGGVSQLGLEHNPNSPRWERPGQPRAALLALGWHLGHTAMCVGHGNSTVAQAEVNSVNTEHLRAPGEGDSPAKVGKEALPGSAGCPCQDVGIFFCLLSILFLLQKVFPRDRLSFGATWF